MMSQSMRQIRGDGLTALLTILAGIAALKGIFGVVFSSTSVQGAYSLEPVTASIEAVVESEDEIVTYNQVQPILKKHCQSCHNENQSRGGLSLTGLDKIEAGSTSGEVVVPGAPEESMLYLVTAHLENPKMPPNKPRIPARELALIEKWIATGLSKELGKTESTPSKTEVASTESDEDMSAMRREPQLLSESNSSTESKEGSFEDTTPFPQLSPISAVAVHPTKPIAVIPGVNQLLWIDIDGKLSTKAIPVAASAITTLSFSRDGKQLLVGCGTPGDWGKIFRWDVESMLWSDPIGDESDTPLCMSESPDGRFLAIGNSTKDINIYASESGLLLHTLKKHTDWVTSVSWSPDGLLLATGDRFGTIYLWETATGSVFTTLRNHVGSVTGLVWSHDGDELFSTGWDGFVRRWDLHSQSELKNWTAHAKGSHGLLSLSEDRTVADKGTIATYGRDGLLRLWTLNGELVSEKSMKEEIVVAAYFEENDDQRIVVCDAAGSIASVEFQADKNTVDNEIALSIPVRSVNPEFTFYRPVAPNRLASVVKEDAVRIVETSSVSIPKSDSYGVKEVESTTSFPSSWKSRIASDLADSQRALESIEQSKAQLLESLSQIEESSARLKQLIAIQEARLKQLEIAEEKK
ncbi:c-type cytochrome domain-containing protein [Pirellulaceae bacterium SH449]